jgi:hypothetical protein
MFGGMILFSDDEFKERIVQCVIRERDGKQMDYTLKKYGYFEIDVEVLIEQEQQDLTVFQIYQQMCKTNIVIIESKCYFEAYYHILKQL